MRVLHLPLNHASIQSHTVRGLRSIGVDARGLVMLTLPVESTEGLKVTEIYRAGPGTLTGTYDRVRFSCQFLREAMPADAVHWYSNARLPYRIDHRVVKLLNRPAIVEWTGSDIRIPEIEYADNPHYQKAVDGGYETTCKNRQESREKQERFARMGFATMARPDIAQYIQTDVYPKVYKIKQRIMISDYTRRYPDPDKKKPVVVHAPSAPNTKGTPTVLKAIEQLRKKHDFDFILAKEMARKDALQAISKADIFLDQFIMGAHGMAALEAMAYGKPVVCYIKPSLVPEYPSDLPIVNANPDNLAEVLEPLLLDGELRRRVGERSRAYVEEHHDAVKLAHQLVRIYRDVASL